MLLLLATALALISNESLIEQYNQRIYGKLKNLSETDMFSKIFVRYGSCPHDFDDESCEETMCKLPEFETQNDDAYPKINLLAIKESYSEASHKNGAKVWHELYKYAQRRPSSIKLVSALHFSVTTHLCAFYSQIFNVYYSNPALFQSKFKREYKDNFLYLYKLVMYSLAHLPKAKTRIPDDLRDFCYEVKALLCERLDKDGNLIALEPGKEHLKPTFDFSEESVFSLMSKDTPEIRKFGEMIQKDKGDLQGFISRFPQDIACLQCEKCRLWGTIQSQGMRAAIKILSNEYVTIEEQIYLLNLFRQLSITVIESKRLENDKFPHSNALVRAVVKLAKCKDEKGKTQKKQ